MNSFQNARSREEMEKNGENESGFEAFHLYPKFKGVKKERMALNCINLTFNLTILKQSRKFTLLNLVDKHSTHT